MTRYRCLFGTLKFSPLSRLHLDGRMQSPFFISIARMHHIRSRAKFRRLQQCADHANVSGLAKTGRPGVLVFEGKKDDISTFLQGVRSLRYLDFHHVATTPLSSELAGHVGGAKPGLREVEDMNTVIKALEELGMKEWFRSELGMSGH